MSFRGFVCWKNETVHQVMETEALQGKTYHFLATHHPVAMRRADRLGTGSKGEPVSQEQFQKEFLDPRKTHAHAAILGSAGSGKSHLIRWLWATTPPTDTRHIVLIPKVHTNLRRVIELVLEGMEGPRFDHYRERLRLATSGLTPKAARDVFLAFLTVAVGSEGPRSRETHGDPDRQEIREYLVDALPSLLQDPTFRHGLVCDGGIVDKLMEHVLGDTGRERREQRRQFTAEDIPLQLTPSHLSRVNHELYGQLASDRTMVDEAVEWMNANMDWAIAQMLSFTGDNLNELMFDVRGALAHQGKELVLLIEDFAKLQGIDTQLLEALLVRPDQGDRRLCVLRSAMAVTTGYYGRMEQTVRDRVEMAVDLDVEGLGDQRVVSRDDLARFSARYLNAVRLQDETLGKWAESQQSEALAPPNACDACPYVRDCHSSFGAVLPPGAESPIGLYPFTRQALDNMFARASRAGNFFNPRLLINEVLKHILLTYTPSLREGRFPPAPLLAHFGGASMPAIHQDRLRNIARPEQFHQYLALFTLWGRNNTLGSLAEGILHAFNLPPLPEGGGDETVPETIADTAAPAEPGHQPGHQPGDGTSAAPLTMPARYRKQFEELDAWANGAPMGADLANTLRPLIFAAVRSRIDWDSERLVRSFYVGDGKEFRQTSIHFEAQATQPPRPPVLLKLPVAMDRQTTAIALQGMLLHECYGNWRFENSGRHLIAYTECIERLSEDTIRQLLRLETEQAAWDPVPAVVELLAIGARMRGGSSRVSIEDRIDSLFEDWPQRREDSPRSRVWGELAIAYGRLNEKLREILLSRVACTKGGNLKAQVVDAAAIATALRGLDGSFDITHPSPPQLRQSYKAITQLQERVRDLLPGAVEAESQRYAAWYQALRSKIEPGTGKVELTKALRDASEEAQTAGVRGGPPTEMLNEDITRFQRSAFERCLETMDTLERLWGPDEAGRRLEELGKDDTLAAMKIIDVFIATAERFLVATSQRVEAEIDRLCFDAPDLEQTRSEIGRGLQRLSSLTAIVAEGGTDSG